MFGKSFYDQWVLKHGKEVADEKMILYKNKMRDSSSGSKNRMFNKPTPYGSGIGWKGWYDGEFFRSIHELVFMINMKTAGIRYKSAEKISIPWVNDKNIKRNYRPDFILSDTNHIIEIKPAALIDLPINKLKHEALVLWCAMNNHSCEIISYGENELLPDNITELIISGNILFMPKFEDRVRRRYGITSDVKFVRD